MPGNALIGQLDVVFLTTDLSVGPHPAGVQLKLDQQCFTGI